MKNLKFAKSVAAGVVGLAMLSSCAGTMEKLGLSKCASKKKESHSCSSNGCKSKKKSSSHSCSANGCKSKKKAAHSCSANGCSSKH